MVEFVRISRISRLGDLSREPLVHFAAIGAFLYALSVVFVPEDVDDRTVRVPQSVYSELSSDFAASRGRRPTADELRALIDTWVSNEALYREAKDLGLDEGDEMIRERIVQKMRVLIAGRIDKVEPTEADLRAFFEGHRENYDVPALIDFSFARLDTDEAAAKRMAAAWNAEDVSIPASVRTVRFRTRPRPAIVDLLGEEATQAIETLAPGVWAPIEGPRGWALARLDAYAPPEPASFRAVRPDVAAKWAEWDYLRRGADAVAEVKKGYAIEYGRPPADAVLAPGASAAMASASRGG